MRTITESVAVIATIFETPWNFTTIPITAQRMTNEYAIFFLMRARTASTVAMTNMIADHISGEIPKPFQLAA